MNDFDDQIADHKVDYNEVPVPAENFTSPVTSDKNIGGGEATPVKRGWRERLKALIPAQLKRVQARKDAAALKDVRDKLLGLSGRTHGSEPSGKIITNIPGLDRQPDRGAQTKDRQISLEQKTAIAQEIYASLVMLRDDSSRTSRLTAIGFRGAIGDGYVDSTGPDGTQRIKIREMISASQLDYKVTDHFSRQEQDTAVEIVTSKVKDQADDSQHQEGDEITKAYINSSSNKVVRRGEVRKVPMGNDKPLDMSEYDLGKLSPGEQDAFNRIRELSVIPGEIVEFFGSYDAFLKACDRPDMSGIGDDPFEKPGIYQGGLQKFVAEIQAKRERITPVQQIEKDFSDPTKPNIVVIQRDK